MCELTSLNLSPPSLPPVLVLLAAKVAVFRYTCVSRFRSQLCTHATELGAPYTVQKPSGSRRKRREAVGKPSGSHREAVRNVGKPSETSGSRRKAVGEAVRNVGKPSETSGSRRKAVGEAVGNVGKPSETSGSRRKAVRNPLESRWKVVCQHEYERRRKTDVGKPSEDLCFARFRARSYFCMSDLSVATESCVWQPGRRAGQWSVAKAIVFE